MGILGRKRYTIRTNRSMKYLQPIPLETLHGFRFIVAPLLTLLIGKVVFELLAFNFPDLNQPLIADFTKIKEIPTAVILNETKARLLWGTSIIVYFFMFTGFAAFICRMLRRSPTKSALLLFISISGLISLVEIIYLNLVDAAKSPLVTIFRFTFDFLVSSGFYSDNELLIIHTILTLINLLAFLVAPFGIMTGCCIMQKRPISSITDLDYLLCQSKRLKELLIGSSAVMVIGIVHMHLWLKWPLSLVLDGAIAKQLEAIILAVSQYWGIIYTLTIAALYLPAAKYLCEQTRTMIMAGNDEDAKKDPDKWLTDAKILVSPTAQLPQLVAVFAPMLVGSFGSSLGNLIQV